MRLFSILLVLLATEAAAQGSPSSTVGEAADSLGQSSSGALVSAPPEPASNVSASAPVNAEASSDEDRWYSLYRGKKFGMQLDAGVPDGAGLLVLFRPYWWLRANAGFAYNYMGTGIRGGVTLMPIRWGLTPTLNFNFGHYFSGDLTKFVTPSNEGERLLYSDAAYDFWSLQVGLEFGSQDGFVFYIRGGLTHLSASPSAQNLTRYLQTTSPYWSARRDLDFTALLPSISLGILIYLL